MNNNILDSIINIDTTIQEADSCVLESLTNLIEKNEQIQEWSDNEDFSELFMESMMWFTEAASKNKDEITKWMAQKGYWYDGDNPKKKKECNRMYQFLKQHDFRPSDGTYLTDFTDGKSKEKKRLKLNIDDMAVTKEEKERYNGILKKVRNGEKLTEDEVSDYVDLKDKMESVQDLLTGSNAYFLPSENSINLGSKTLKSKQYHSQSTLKHEEGHADSYNNGTRPYEDSEYESLKDITRWKNDNLPDDHPAVKALEEHKKNGKYVNAHDNSTEELMADAYAAQHSKIRNKHKGSKNAKGERNITKSEVQRSFDSMPDLFTQYNKWVNAMEKTAENRIPKFKAAIDGLKNINVSEMAYDTSENFFSDLQSKLKAIGVKTDGFDYVYSVYDRSSGDELMESSMLEDYSRKYVDDLTGIKRTLEGWIAFDKAIKSDDDNQWTNCMRKYKDVYAEIQKYGTKNIKEEIDRCKSRYDKLSSMMHIKIEKDKKELYLKFKSFMNHGRFPSAKSLLADYFKPIIDGLEKSIKVQEKIKKTAKNCLQETLTLRANFAKQYVKEYFEELTNDYYFAE